MSRKIIISLIAVFLAGALFASLAFANKQILFSKDPSALFYAAGRYYFYKNEFEKAAYNFKKAADLMPNFAEANYNLGISYYYIGENEKALDYLKRSIQIKEEYSKAYYSIGLIYYNKKDFDNSVINLVKAAQLEPNNPNIHFDLAIAYVDRFKQKESKGTVTRADLEDLRNAVVRYKKTQEIKPEFQNAKNNADVVKRVLDYYMSINP